MPAKTTKKPATRKPDKPALQAAPPPAPFKTIELAGNLSLVSLSTEVAVVKISAPSSPEAYTLGIPVAWLRAQLAQVDEFLASQAAE